MGPPDHLLLAHTAVSMPGRASFVRWLTLSTTECLAAWLAFLDGGPPWSLLCSAGDAVLRLGPGPATSRDAAVFLCAPASDEQGWAAPRLAPYPGPWALAPSPIPMGPRNTSPVVPAPTRAGNA